MQLLQDLGEQLVGLTKTQLRSMALGEGLHDALVAAAEIRSRGALRRQYQLIGKLMRDVDPEPIRRTLEKLQQQQSIDKKIFRLAEQWRDRIVDGGPGTLNEFFEMTGSRAEDLTALAKEYHASSTDAVRKKLRRRIFRRVHEELAVQYDSR